jgi:hypothetical protein
MSTMRNALAAAAATIMLEGVAGGQEIRTTLDATPPAQSEEYFAPTTGTFTGHRMVQDRTPSRCGHRDSYPGPYHHTGSYAYDTFTFIAQESRCHVFRGRLIISTDPGVTVHELHFAIYSAFDPNDVVSGYLADSGHSTINPNGVAFSVDLVEGQTYTLVAFQTISEDSGALYEVFTDERITTTASSVLSASPPWELAPFGAQRTAEEPSIPTLVAPASSCGAPEAVPGTTAAGLYRVDVLTLMVPFTDCLTVTVLRLGASDAIAVAAFSAYGGGTSGWLADSGAATSAGVPSVSFSVPVTAGQEIDIVVLNTTPSGPDAPYDITLSSPVQPPRTFRTTAVDGSNVTFRWAPPINGPTPTSYVVEGGVQPGQVLASVALTGTNPITTVTHVPTGAFYVRMKSVAGAATSAPSNETRIVVHQSTVPSAATNLLGAVAGNAVNLTWRNTFTGGQPTALVLDVTGSVTATVPLSASQQSVGFDGVGGGTYRLALRATNDAGSSPPSNPVTVTVPGPCTGVPEPPANVTAFRVGRQVTVVWDPPAIGPAPTNYTLTVTGAFNGAFAISGPSASAAVDPGSYTFTLRSNHACGTSVPTSPHTVVVS